MVVVRGQEVCVKCFSGSGPRSPKLWRDFRNSADDLYGEIGVRAWSGIQHIVPSKQHIQNPVFYRFYWVRNELRHFSPTQNHVHMGSISVFRS